jgi:hypothetical protein
MIQEMRSFHNFLPEFFIQHFAFQVKLTLFLLSFSSISSNTNATTTFFQYRQREIVIDF